MKNQGVHFPGDAHVHLPENGVDNYVVIDRRQAEPLTQWHQDHTGVEVLVRDRAEAYILAGRDGAPQALQVADRFHLARNVSDTLKELLRSRQWTIPTRKPEAALRLEIDGATPRQMKEPQPTPRKEALWEAVQQRKGSGQYIRTIARELGVCQRTVRKYLAADRPPIYRKRAPGQTKLTPYYSERFIDDRNQGY